MINRLWNWLTGMFSDRSVRQKEAERLGDDTVKLEAKEKEMSKTPSIKEVAKAIKNKVTGKKEPATIFHRDHRGKELKVPAGHLNREMRRFLKRMGWTQADGSLLAPRGTTKELWKALDSIRTAKINLPMKRVAFTKAFGK